MQNILLEEKDTIRYQAKRDFSTEFEDVARLIAANLVLLFSSVPCNCLQLGRSDRLPEERCLAFSTIFQGKPGQSFGG